MATQSQKNSEQIIKLQGEMKLIHNKISVIKEDIHRRIYHQDLAKITVQL